MRLLKSVFLFSIFSLFLNSCEPESIPDNGASVTIEQDYTRPMGDDGSGNQEVPIDDKKDE